MELHDYFFFFTEWKTKHFDLSKTNIRFFKFCQKSISTFHFLASMDCPTKRKSMHIRKGKLIWFYLLPNLHEENLSYIFMRRFIRRASFNFKYFAIKALSNFNIKQQLLATSKLPFKQELTSWPLVIV